MEILISPWVTLFIGLVGAAAWFSPYIDKRFFSKPTLRGHLISNHLNQGKFNNKNGLMHFLAINVTSLHNSFNIKTTNIRIWYKNEPTEYKGKQFWARYNEWVDTAGDKLRLDIKPEDSLLFVGTIPQNITKTIYLTFFVDKAQPASIEH